MEADKVLIARYIFSAFFFIQSFFGTMGYITQNTKGFRQLSQYQANYGKKIGTGIHFCKVSLLPLLLSFFVIFPPNF
ncbi:MAG: hypothetical protein COB02_12705 [Candidatus Cloacimonadota bacterium]|nr:MAG: hypothetical protein COB02_12705 [Candidatus Cloacimonadota bacterium]